MRSDLRSGRGFTLLEVAVTVAIIGIVAAMAIPIMTAARRNASVGSTTWELALYMKGLRSRALTDQRDLVLVLVDAKGNDARSCGLLSSELCTRRFLLAPATAWRFKDFAPASPAANAGIVEQGSLPRGIRFYLPATGRAASAPFDSVKMLDATLTRACGADGALCVAIRFSADGWVSAEAPGTTPVSSKGVAVSLGSDLVGQHAGVELRAVLVGFPSGIVRSYGIAP